MKFSYFSEKNIILCTKLCYVKDKFLDRCFATEFLAFKSYFRLEGVTTKKVTIRSL